MMSSTVTTMSHSLQTQTTRSWADEWPTMKPTMVKRSMIISHSCEG